MSAASDEVASVGDALRYLIDHDVALILLDVEMPVVSGFQPASTSRDSKPWYGSKAPLVFEEPSLS